MTDTGNLLGDDDVGRIERWVGQPLVVEGRASAGASNVTWLVRLADRPAVLRHPPRSSQRLPSAHDVVREARIVDALAGSPVPVPEVLAVCDDHSVLGVEFVISSRLPGICLMTDIFDDPDRRRLAHDAVDRLVAIHALDPALTPLEARDGSYLERQISRWQTQLGRTPTARRLGDLAPIIGWLREHRPPTEERTLVHGDYGFHNLLVTTKAVTAVLDWELATLGDPVADLFSFLKSWGPNAGAPNPANDVVATGPGAVGRDDLVSRYARATGRDIEAHTAFYEAFSLWRSVGILEGIHARTGGARFVDEVPHLVATIESLIASNHPR